MNQSDAPAIIDGLYTSLCSHFPGVNSRVELVTSTRVYAGTVLRAVGWVIILSMVNSYHYVDKLPLEHIVSSYAILSKTECSLKCIQKGTWLGDWSWWVLLLDCFQRNGFHCISHECPIVC